MRPGWPSARLAVILTDAEGRVAWANAGGEALLRAGDGLKLVLGCLACVRHDETQQLARLIAAAGRTARPAREAALRVTRPDGAQHLEVLVAPLLPGAGARLGVSPTARVLVAARRPQHRTVEPRLLQQLYGLKPSEARLAAALLAGQTLEAYAARTGLSVQTARSYMKGVFEATGTHRQSELVLLLAQGPLKLLG